MADDLVVRKDKYGRSVFAGRAYRAGEVICSFRGKKKKSSIPSLNGWMGRRDASLLNLLQIGKNVYMDLDKPFVLINHSCDPNCGLRGTATLFALKRIKKGDEITYDYSTNIDETFECRCGAKNCRRFVPVDFWGIPRNRQRYYFEKGALPDYIIKRYKKYHGS